MRIEGKHKCNSSFGPCGHAYEWMVQVAQHMDTRNYEVEEYDKPLGRIIEQADGEYTIQTICPNCNQYNTFKHKQA